MLPLRIADLSESRETLASSPRASLEKYTRLRTMPSSVVNPVAVRYNVRFLLVELLDKYAVRCTSRRALSHSIAGSRNATLSIMEHAWKGKTRLEIKSTRHLVALLSSSTERCEWRRMRLARRNQRWQTLERYDLSLLQARESEAWKLVHKKWIIL